MEPTHVTRSVELPVAVEEAWRSIASAEGLAGWLGDHVEVEVVVGGAGRVADSSTTRRMVVTEVVEGAQLGFTWWDEAEPAHVSTVTIAVAPAADGDGSTVTVTERIAGGARAQCADAGVADLGAVEHRWDARLDALLGAGAPALAAAQV